MARHRIPKQSPRWPVLVVLLSTLPMLTLGACGGNMDAIVAGPDTLTTQVVNEDPGDAAEGRELEEATEAAIIGAAKRSVEKAAAELEAALTYLTQLLEDQTPEQPEFDAPEYNPALQAPVTKSSYTFDRETLHTTSVGLQGPHIVGLRHDGLERLSDRNGVIVSYGTLDEWYEGFSHFEVIAYLLAFESPTHPGVSTFADAPVVRLAEGTSTEFMDYTVRALQEINAALPATSRLQISETPAPPRSNAVPDGQIFVDFIESKDDWPKDPSHLGTTTGDEHARPKASAHVWLNVEHIREAAEQLAVFRPEVTFKRAMLDIVTHEMLHAIGFDGGHIDYDQYPKSIMHNSPLPTSFGTTCGGSISCA